LIKESILFTSAFKVIFLIYIPEEAFLTISISVPSAEEVIDEAKPQ